MSNPFSNQSAPIVNGTTAPTAPNANPFNFNFGGNSSAPTFPAAQNGVSAPSTDSKPANDSKPLFSFGQPHGQQSSNSSPSFHQPSATASPFNLPNGNASTSQTPSAPSPSNLFGAAPKSTFGSTLNNSKPESSVSSNPFGQVQTPSWGFGSQSKPAEPSSTATTPSMFSQPQPPMSPSKSTNPDAMNISPEVKKPSLAPAPQQSKGHVVDENTPPSETENGDSATAADNDDTPRANPFKSLAMPPRQTPQPNATSSLFTPQKQSAPSSSNLFGNLTNSAAGKLSENKSSSQLFTPKASQPTNKIPSTAPPAKSGGMFGELQSKTNTPSATLEQKPSITPNSSNALFASAVKKTPTPQFSSSSSTTATPAIESSVPKNTARHESGSAPSELSPRQNDELQLRLRTCALNTSLLRALKERDISQDWSDMLEAYNNALRSLHGSIANNATAPSSTAHKRKASEGGSPETKRAAVSSDPRHDPFRLQGSPSKSGQASGNKKDADSTPRADDKSAAVRPGVGFTPTTAKKPTGTAPLAFQVPNFGASSGSTNFMQQFGQTAAAEEAKAKAKRRAEEFDSDDSDADEDAWSKKYDEEQKEKRAKIEAARANAPKFVFSKSSASGSEGEGAAKADFATSNADGFSISRTPTPSTSGGNSVFDDPEHSKKMDSNNLFAHLAGKSQSQAQDGDDGSASEGEVEEDDDGKTTQTGQSTPGASLFGRMSRGNEDAQTGKDKSTVDFGAFGKKSLSAASGTNSVGSGDNTFKHGSPIRFAAPTSASAATASALANDSSNQQKPLFSFTPIKTTVDDSGRLATATAAAATPAGKTNLFSSFGSTTPAGSPTKSTNVGFSFGAPPTANVSALSSAMTSRATTPGLSADETSAAESTAGPTGDGEGGGTETPLPQQRDLAALTPEEQAAEEVLFEAAKVKVSQRSASSDTTSKGEASAAFVARGVGPLRILRHRESGAVRMLMRVSGNGKVVINARLMPGIPAKKVKPKLAQVTLPSAAGKLEAYFVQAGVEDVIDGLVGAVAQNSKKG